MTAVRPYKEPRSVASALAECHEHAGGQFDHEVVRALDAVHAAGSFGEHGVSAHAA